MALSLERYTGKSLNTEIHKLLKERINAERERSMLVAMEKIDDDLPEILVSEILSWLPAKDLLQFKSVCKSWYSLISSSGFISKHLKNYYKNNDSWRSCLVVVDEANYLMELLLDETPRLLSQQKLFGLPARQDLICGPCDGIYYLYQHNYHYRTLWNPTINELKPLPEIIRKPGLPISSTGDLADFDLADSIGLGRDPITADYKVVILKIYRGCRNESNGAVEYYMSVFVYSLRSNSWKYCGDLTRAYFMEDNSCYMHLDGFYYWFGSCNNSTSEGIVCFDMATDTFKEMDVPDYAQPSSKCLAVYNSSLAFLSVQKTTLLSGQIFDIWTFRHGSWTKALTMDSLPHTIWIPLGHWKDNLILLQTEDGKLVLIDPHSKQLVDTGFQWRYQCRGVYAYMESLVTIKDRSKSEEHHEEVEAAAEQP